MALNDIVFSQGEQIGFVQNINRGNIGVLSDIISVNDNAAVLLLQHIPGWPVEADVKLGVDYGPTGVEYTGTYAPGGGTTCSRARVVNA